jgi:hypothetical protein
MADETRQQAASPVSYKRTCWRNVTPHHKALKTAVAEGQQAELKLRCGCD